MYKRVPTTGDGASFLKKMYEPRVYRQWMKNTNLTLYRVVDRETDLQISTNSDLSKKVAAILKEYRYQLTEYIALHPHFLSSLKPVQAAVGAPLIVTEMVKAAESADVGPMAAVAGAIAEFVGRELMQESTDVIIENGGDIFISSTQDRVVGIYAGTSPLSGRIGIKVKALETPLGICTSSGTVGHSLSFGKADAAIVVSNFTVLADAVATAMGNLIRKDEDIQKGLDFAAEIDGIKGAVIIKGEKIGVYGEVEIAR
jgi:ApbE superfamily uncharacterized protein (UPF0280 family)